MPEGGGAKLCKEKGSLGEPNWGEVEGRRRTGRAKTEAKSEDQRGGGGLSPARSTTTIVLLPTYTTTCFEKGERERGKRLLLFPIEERKGVGEKRPQPTPTTYLIFLRPTPSLLQVPGAPPHPTPSLLPLPELQVGRRSVGGMGGGIRI